MKRKSDLTVLEIAQGLLPVGEDKEETAGDRFMGDLGYISIHFSQARASNQTPGIPDRKYYHVERRETLWWEAKAADGKQRKAQRVFQVMAERCGEVYVLGTAAVLAAWVANRRERDRG